MGTPLRESAFKQNILLPWHTHINPQVKELEINFRLKNSKVKTYSPVVFSEMPLEFYGVSKRGVHYKYTQDSAADTSSFATVNHGWAT